MIENIHAIIDKKFDEEVKELQKLLKIKSVFNSKEATEEYPLGKGNADCLNLFLELAKSKGFSVKNIDNMIGFAEIGDKKELIGVLAHLDVVPEGNVEKWITPPYAAEIIDGRLYGRGALDDKGALLAAFYAMTAIKEAQIELKKRFRFIVGCDEEVGFRCVERYLKSEEIPTFSFSPDAQFPVVNGEKGILHFAIKRTFKPLGPEPVKLLGMVAGEAINIVPDEAKAYFSGKVEKIKVAIEDLGMKDIEVAYVDDYLEVKAVGKSTHAQHPQNGKNAIQILFDALSKLDFAPQELKYWLETVQKLIKYESFGESLGIAAEDEISGKLTFNPAILWFKRNELIMKFDIRYPISMKSEDALQLAERVAQRFGAMLQIISNKSPLYVEADKKEVKMLLNAYEKITGAKGEAISIGGGTYARAFPNAVSFGPRFIGDEETIHQVNEYVTLENLKKMTHIYAEALFNLNE